MKLKFVVVAADPQLKDDLEVHAGASTNGIHLPRKGLEVPMHTSTEI